jgi:hypothetical protein
LGDPISKITIAKWTGGVVQAVRCLLCKHEALSSNSSQSQKKKKKKEKKYLPPLIIESWPREFLSL